MRAACDRGRRLGIIRADNGRWCILNISRILNDEKDREVFRWD